MPLHLRTTFCSTRTIQERGDSGGRAHARPEDGNSGRTSGQMSGETARVVREVQRNLIVMKAKQTDTEVAVEQAQQLADELREIAELISERFSRAEARERALTYLRGLLSPVERKNGWQLAEEAGDETQYATQHLLGRAVWSADEVRNDLRDYVVKHLGDEGGALV